MKKPKIDSVWKTNLVVSGNRYQIMGLKPDSVILMIINNGDKKGRRVVVDLKTFLDNFVEVENEKI